MAWNEPGKNGDNNDPWGGGGRRRNSNGPPDIEEILKNLTKKVTSLFGGGSGNSTGNSGGKGTGGARFSGGLAGGLILAVVVVWAFMGFYSVDEAERGVVMRFGKVLDALVLPGLRWNPPIIDQVTKVNTQQLITLTSRNDMLTTDENILNIEVSIQYRIQDPVNYVIAVENPVRSLDNATQSAVRHAVGGIEMNQILTTGRARLTSEVHERLQDYMDAYTTGILVSQVILEDARPPDAVRPAFDDVIEAREDEQRAQNMARQYANQIIPEARGNAQQYVEQANAYKQEVIAKAVGDASRFNQLLTEYQKAPEVTRQRLYIDSIENVMSNASKIMIDVEGGSNMLYLPLDKMLEQSSSRSTISTDRELRDLANQLAPYLLQTPLTGNTVDRSRLNLNPPSRGR